MNRPDAPPPPADTNDALLRRYREASALDDARPSPALREAVLAQARAAAAQSAPAGKTTKDEPIGTELIAPHGHFTLGSSTNDHKNGPSEPPEGLRAANDTSWRLRAVAGVAVVGLATLLFLQFERGTPDERELTRGAPAVAPPSLPTRQGRTEATDRVQAGAATDPSAPATEPAASAPSVAKTPAPTPTPALAPRERPAPSSAMPAGASATEAGADRGAVETSVPPGPVSGLMKSAPQAPVPPPSPAPESAPARSRVAPPTPASERESKNDGLAPSIGVAAPGALSPPQRLLAAANTGQSDAARQALADGAPVNTANAAGQTALMLAARRGDEPMVRLLLAAGADRATTDPAGRTAADLARQQGHAALAPLLLAPESALPAPVR